MQPVTMYTKDYCGYCRAAKALLHDKGVAFDEISIDGNAELRAEMIQKSGGRFTVPQIWVGDTHIGGYDDLYDLEFMGKLDPMLEA